MATKSLPSPVKKTRPAGDVLKFMDAISGQESGGDYTAENARTGAYGRFQIMPSNWPSWSREAGLDGAAQTPENQEKVAHYKLQQYYDKYKNWEDVASAWYSGQPRSSFTPEQLARKQRAGDEPSIQEYVDSVMGRFGQSPNVGKTLAGSPGNRIYNPRGHDNQDWHYGDSPGVPKRSAPGTANPLPSVGQSAGTTTGEIPGSAGDFNIPNPSPSAVYRKSGTSKLPSPVVRPPAYVATGRYDDDMNGYSAAEQAALDKLDGIQDRIIRVNANGTAEAFKGFIATDGNFYEDPSEMPDGVSPDVDSQGQPKEVWVIDPEASQYARDADSAHKAQLRLDARRKAGLTQSGDDAAKAYLESEKTKAGEADRSYGNYMTRIKDLQALKDLPTAKSLSVASALNAGNTANSKRTHQGSALATVNAPPPEDYSSQIAGLRNSVAGPVPGQYNIDTSHLPGGKLFPPPDPSIQIPGVPFQSNQSGVAGSLNSGLDPSQLGPQVAPTAQTFTNPFAKLGGR